MKNKVYQTIFCNKKGNCYAAILASLLDLDLEEVPNFAEADNWDEAVESFMLKHGYEYAYYTVNGKRREDYKNKFFWFEKELPQYLSINGYYDAIVYSPGFFDQDKYDNDPEYSPSCHAVVVDKDFNIVHDPNPNYAGIEKYPLADTIGYNGIIGVVLWKKTNDTDGKN
jgi:hypothetical protein